MESVDERPRKQGIEMYESGTLNVDIEEDKECLSQKYRFLEISTQQTRFKRQKSPAMPSVRNCPCKMRSKVLIVDDNVFNIATVESILDIRYGLSSEKALNGQEAVDIVKKREEKRRDSPCTCGEETSSYSIILMDCNMPVMDGFKATQTLKQMFSDGTVSGPLFPSIIALTAYSSHLCGDKCLASGMEKVLEKPLTAPQLEQILVDKELL